jgi:hypothetical protein
VRHGERTRTDHHGCGQHRQNVKQEVKRAEEALLLRARLGHASARATADILNPGIVNYRTTCQDFRRAEMIFGPSVAELKGKMAHH